MSNRTEFSVAVVAASVLLYLATFGVRTTRLPTMQNLVAKNIAVGTPADQVLRFLDAQKLEHSQLMRPEVMSISGHHYDNLPVITAIKRNTMRSLFVHESIEIVFVFDEKEQLERFDVIPIFTGL